MNRVKKIIKTSVIGILTNILLVIAKAIIGLLVNSIAIIIDAVNNLTDAMSSVITIVGTHLSSKRPNKKHPFGYGRIEYITSAIISVIILSAGAMAIYQAIQNLINKDVAEYTYVTIIIVSLAIVVKIFLGLYFVKVGKSVTSESLIASGKDALFDALLSFGTLIGVLAGNMFLGMVIGIGVGIIAGVGFGFLYTYLKERNHK